MQRLTEEGRSSDPADEALHWVARKLSGSMNAEERRRFDDWIAASATNRAAFSNAEALLGAVDEDGDGLLAAEFERQLHDAADKQRADRRTVMMRIAASLVAAGALAVVAIFFAGEKPITTANYGTAVGQSQHVTLHDGSEIELNTASRIAVTFAADERSVKLAAGEAFFNVEKDRARPFVVSTPAAKITVTGTSFSVSTYDGGAVVRVLTGVVDVAPTGGQQATLLAGDMIRIGDDGVGSPVERFDAGLDFAWRTGKLRFRGEPLGEVLPTLNRYFETPITLADERLATIPVSAEFDITDRETTLRALEVAFDLEVADEPARTILRKAADQ